MKKFDDPTFENVIRNCWIQHAVLRAQTIPTSWIQHSEMLDDVGSNMLEHVGTVRTRLKGQGKRIQHVGPTFHQCWTNMLDTFVRQY